MLYVNQSLTASLTTANFYIQGVIAISTVTNPLLVSYPRSVMCPVKLAVVET
jgi:hypothetical protein